MHSSDLRALPPAPPLGVTMTGNVWPFKTFRRRPVQASGIVTRVCSHAIEVRNAGGFLMIDATTARRIHVAEPGKPKRKRGADR